MDKAVALGEKYQQKCPEWLYGILTFRGRLRTRTRYNAPERDLGWLLANLARGIAGNSPEAVAARDAFISDAVALWRLEAC